MKFVRFLQLSFLALLIERKEWEREEKKRKEKWL